jgi:Uma2 family endonuclease
MRSPDYFISVSEYLEIELSSEIRHEYFEGEIFAMAGASEEHNLIAGNLYSIIRQKLKGGACRVFMSDMKVSVKIRETNIFYYPDLIVTCDPLDKDRYFKSSPNLIIEVLSIHTKLIDKREKLLSYQSIPSLQEYIMISQDQIKVEVYRQDIEGSWKKEILDKDGELYLSSIDITLKMTDIYEDVFEA